MLLWQLLTERLSLFFEQTWLLDSFYKFLLGEFSLLWGKQSKHSRNFNWQNYKKICTSFLEEFEIFALDSLHERLYEIWWFFRNSEKKKHPIHVPVFQSPGIFPFPMWVLIKLSALKLSSWPLEIIKMLIQTDASRPFKI